MGTAHTQVSAPASLSLCHHDSSQAIRAGIAPQCLSPGGEHFSQQQGGLLGSEAEVSLAHWKSPTSATKGQAGAGFQALQLQLVECGMPIQETEGRRVGGGDGGGGRLPVSSASDSELGCMKEQGRDLPVCCSSCREVSVPGLAAFGNPCSISFPLGSSPEFWDICHCATARKGSGPLRLSLFTRSILC